MGHSFLAPPPLGPVLPARRPTFSVLIAAYNVAHLIGEAIESALGQTVPPHEVIVCDDGSTDDLDAALAPYEGRVVLLRKEHGGEASAKNTAAAAARGDLAVFLDGDDIFLPRRLEALGALAEARPDLDILTTDAYLVLEGRRIRRCYEGGWTFPLRDQRREILRRNFVFGHAAVRPERLLDAGGFDEAIRWTTDWDLWLRLILDGAQAGAVAEPLALYRLRQTSLSADRDRLLRGKLETLEKARSNPALRPDERPALERALAGYRRDLRLSELRDELARSSGGRRAAVEVALARGFSPRQRAEAAAGALTPRLTGSVLRARAERFWTAAGGIRVDRRPRRIAVYTDSPSVGGAEHSLAHLVAALSPRFEVTVLAVRPEVADVIAAGRPAARVQVLPFIRSRHDLRGISAHVRALLSIRPHVFHANLISPWACQMAVFLAQLAPRVRVVAVEQLPVPPANELQRRLKRLTAARLDAHVAVGERSARDVERLVGLPPGVVRTIHNGVPAVDRPGAAAGNPGNGAIGALGRLEEQKGFDVLLRALAALPGATLTIVGDGPERERLHGLANQLGVADRVRWAGWSDSPGDLLPSFDVVVFPSRFEGFPLAVLEAMLAERAVVASAVGSVPEAVRDGETGLLVPADDPKALADALAALLNDPHRRRELGERARALVLERYTDKAMTSHFEALYAELGV